ncbi:MAG: hypothetical protein HY905_00925 [Deltaproteobacteria bacterium]|nr:hypothetical protein [Deltaproteobacteria bacterium]
MSSRLPTAPDPAALAALQAETVQGLRATLDELRARAVALGQDAAPQAVADALREAGALRDRIQHDLRMGRIARGPARALQREVDDLGRGAQERRRELGRRREEQHEARVAHTMALPAAVQEFIVAVAAYDPLAKGREKADAVIAARDLVQRLLEAGADPGKAHEAMARYDEARRDLATKYKQREAVARESYAHVDGLILGLRAALAEVGVDAPKELLAVVSNARRKVVEAFRELLLPKEMRTRLQGLFEPLDQRHREILDARHRAYLERKERRERQVRERQEWEERRERERRERADARRREQVVAEAKMLHYASMYCSYVYAYDPAQAPKGEAAKVRLARRPFDILLRDRVGRPSRVNRIVQAVRTAALDFEDLLEKRRKIFVGDREDHGPAAPLPSPVADDREAETGEADVARATPPAAVEAAVAPEPEAAVPEAAPTGEDEP